MRHFGKLLAALLIAAFFGGCAQPAAEGNFKRGLNDYGGEFIRGRPREPDDRAHVCGEDG